MMQKLTLLTLICSLAMLSGCKKEFPVTPDPFTTKKSLLIQEEWRLAACTTTDTSTGVTRDEYPLLDLCFKSDKLVIEEVSGALKMTFTGCFFTKFDPGTYKIAEYDLNYEDELFLTDDAGEDDFVGSITTLNETTMIIEWRVNDVDVKATYHNRRNFKVSK